MPENYGSAVTVITKTVKATYSSAPRLGRVRSGQTTLTVIIELPSAQVQLNSPTRVELSNSSLPKFALLVARTSLGPKYQKYWPT